MEELEAVIAPLCANAGAELVDVELRQHTLQVTIEREGGLDLDAISAVARAISDTLDERADLVPVAPFDLEVSSPGLERRLRRPLHFSRALGSLVALRTLPGTPGQRRVEGELSEVDDEGIVLRTGDGARRIAFAEIERAHTVFDWRAALAAHSGEGDDADADLPGAEHGTPEDGVPEQARRGARPKAASDSRAVGLAPRPAGSAKGGPTTKERQSR